MPCFVQRVGHVGIHVKDVERSIQFYREILGLKLTGKWGPPDFRRGICFMRCGEMHHDLVLFELAEDAKRAGLPLGDSEKRAQIGLHHIAFEAPDRETWLHALQHVRGKGVQLVSGPYTHGPEGSDGDSFVGGSGSHAFYFLDPDENRVEVYCWMMRVSRPSIAAPAPDL